MYFFYFDESGSRDPSIGTPEKPKDHLYVLLAVGMFEYQWRPFDNAISMLKLELADHLHQAGKDRFELADCEVKSTWVRNAGASKRRSPFLHALSTDDLTSLTDIYYQQVVERKTRVIATVIDKRYLYEDTTQETLHKTAYEFVLERIQNYMNEYHGRKHQALIVMDDTNKQLNRTVAMKHALFQRVGNQNMNFPAIVEYPFFTRSELSNGVQLADLLAYNVYRAFRDENLAYPYFDMLLPNIYRGRNRAVLHGLKVWPDASPLVRLAQDTWEAYRRKALMDEGF